MTIKELMNILKRYPEDTKVAIPVWYDDNNGQSHYEQEPVVSVNYSEQDKMILLSDY